MLSNRHKLHRFHIFPKRGAPTSPLKILEKNRDDDHAEKPDDQAQLVELTYDDDFGLDDKAYDWSDKKNGGNMTVNTLEFDNTNDLLEKMLEKSRAYFSMLDSDANCRYLRPFSENNVEYDSGYAPSDISSSGNHVPSLKYDGDWPSSPDSTFLVPLSIIRWTKDTSSDEILNLEYEFDYLLSKVSETKIVTAIFEAQDLGLEELAENFDREMYAWIEENNKMDENNNLSTEDQGHFVAVCCEIFWSVPLKKRNINTETKMKQGFSKYMRHNNWRVWNTIDKINEKSNNVQNQQSKFVVLPASSVDEQYSNNGCCFTGSYRRFYDGLLPMKHAEAEAAHRPVWDFGRSGAGDDCSNSAAVPDMPWPMIGPQSKTAVLMLNLLCLRFEHL